MNRLFELLGPSVYDSFSLIMTFVETELCITLFAAPLEHRRHFFLRNAGLGLMGIAFCCFLGNILFAFPTLWVRVLCYLAVNIYCFLFIHGAYRHTLNEILLVFCFGSATYQLVNKLYPLIQNLLGINDKTTISLFHPLMNDLQNWEWLLYYGFRIGMFLLLSRLLTPKARLNRNRQTSLLVAILFVAMVFSVNVLTCIGRVYESESMAISILIKAFCVDVNVMILFACACVFSQNEREHQMDILQQMWKQDQAQFQSVKANMDVINMKCHDLKHIFNRIEDKLNEEELTQLREAITFYDANIKTGNEVLDVVLCEKSLLCQKQGIQFLCMGNGEPFSFLTPVQTYTIFSNIIDNAVEAAQDLRDAEKKVISITLQNSGSSLEIEESNYFEGARNLSDGLPDTTKPDGSRHGFGLKSIQYIAAQYGGKVETAVQEDMFFLNIRFPVPT